MREDLKMMLDIASQVTAREWLSAAAITAVGVLGVVLMLIAA